MEKWVKIEALKMAIEYYRDKKVSEEEVVAVAGYFEKYLNGKPKYFTN